MLPQLQKVAPLNMPVLFNETLCPQPLEAVLRTMSCIETEDLDCAMAGYGKGFEKIHNGIVDEFARDLDNPFFWGMAFLSTDFDLDFNFMDVPADNLVSLRYVERITTLNMTRYQIDLGSGPIYGPEPHTIVQHEHALVKVNGDCQIIEWDQYGDNKEQTDVMAYVALTAPFLDQYIECLVNNPNNPDICEGKE